MKLNKTTSFLLYAAGLEPDLLLRYGLQNAYLDDHGHEKPENTKSIIDIFILLKPKAFDEDFEDMCCALRSHSNFLEEYDIGEDVMFRFKLEEKWSHIKKQLITSKYSLIDREYVKEFFPEKTIQAYDKYLNPIYKKSMNYKILLKDPELKDYWEEKLDVTIHDDYELWEKIHKNEEVFRYVEVKEFIEM